MTIDFLHQLLFYSADKYPQKCAVKDLKGNQISYHDLKNAVIKTSEILKEAGFKKGDRIGIYSHKSIDTLIALFSCSLTGAIYVPLPIDSPFSRINYIIDNCEIQWIFTEDILGNQFTDISQIKVAINQQQYQSNILLINLNTICPQQDEISQDLAYILYTSGSTGKPKGVTFTQRNALSFLDWCSQTFQPNENLIFSSHAPFHFDLSIIDIFLSVKHGATLILIDEKSTKNPLLLAQIIATEKITNWYSTPTILKLLLQYGKLEKYDYTHLKTVLFAGEVFHVKYLRALKKIWHKPTYYNLYGPTETNVCTYFKIPDLIPENQEEPFAIGKVCEHLKASLLPLEKGNGELCISGEGVTQGYWKLPQLNNSRFFKDEEGKRWYKTGDIVKIDNNGNYVFIDRLDRMVKRRGYRIELGEIESVLNRHDLINDVAVVATINEKQDVVVCAYLVVEQQKGMDVISLKQFCGKYLPSYMIPDRFLFIDNIPKTNTDKTDYQKLKQLY